VTVETPNGIEFSIGAKAYLCSGRMFPPAGMMFGYPTPQGTKADQRTMARCILGITLDWLQTSGYIQIWQDVARSGLTKADAIVVRAAYSGAPGLSGQFLENTRWADTNLIDISSRFFPHVEAPVIGFLDNVSRRDPHARRLRGARQRLECRVARLPAGGVAARGLGRVAAPASAPRLADHRPQHPHRLGDESDDRA
jgi:hypothetical protein